MACKRIEYIFEERSNGKLPTHKQSPRKYKNHHKENEKIRKEKRKELMNLKRDFSKSSPSIKKENLIDNVIKQFASMALPTAKKAIPTAKKAIQKAKKKFTRKQIAKRKRIFKKILKKKNKH